MSTSAPPRSAPQPVATRPVRRGGRRHRRMLAVFAGIAVVATAAWMVSRSPLLDVDHLEVRGNERVTADEVAAAADVRKGDALVWLDPTQVAARVEALAWVRDARVERALPDTLRITIAERRAVAWIDAGNGSAVLVDPSGRVLGVEPVPPAQLPQLLDVAPGTPVGATIVPAEGARVAGALEGLVQASIESIAVLDGRVTMVGASGQEIRMGEPTQVRAKVNAAVAVLGSVGGAGKQYVDVSAPSNPVAG